MSEVSPSPAGSVGERSEPIAESVLPAIETARIGFLAAGDDVIHKGVLTNAARRAGDGREYDFRPMFDNVKQLISSYDLAFINQETLMAGEEYGYSFYPTFNSPRSLALDLIDTGFDIFNIANNHMCDMGTSGLKSTVDYWKTLDVTMIGGYSDAADYDTPRMIELEGVKLAFIGYTEETNGIRLRSSEPIVPYTRDTDITRQISAAAEAADIVIVSVHWGNENTNKPTSEQKRLARLMAESGADVIIGHHPHVLQPIEWIEVGTSRTLCIYSLGNLLSMMANWQNMVGGFLTFDIVRMSDGEVFIDSPKFTATVFYFNSGFSNSCIYYLSDFTEEQAAAHGTVKNYGSRATAEEMRAYAKRIMGDYLVE